MTRVEEAYNTVADRAYSRDDQWKAEGLFTGQIKVRICSKGGVVQLLTAAMLLTGPNPLL